MSTIDLKEISHLSPNNILNGKNQDQCDENQIVNHPRWKNWLERLKHRKHNYCEQGENSVMLFSNIEFVIPKRIHEFIQERRSKFDLAKLNILRMDECLMSSSSKNKTISCRQNDNYPGLQALAAEAAICIRRFTFLEILRINTIPLLIGSGGLDKTTKIDDFVRKSEKINRVLDCHQTKDFGTFYDKLLKHRVSICNRPTKNPSELSYLKFCLLLELERDCHESCLRIFLHDVIFKDHLANFRLHCHIHLRKPIENEMIIERAAMNCHLENNYSAEFIIWSGDWIVEQEIELYIILTIESLTINKFSNSKFCDIAQLHVKHIPHGSSKTFLRELTLIARPYRILSRVTRIDQVEIEATFFSTRRQLSVHHVHLNLRHSKSDRSFRVPEIYVDFVFQNTFQVLDSKQKRFPERSFDPTLNEEISFEIPETAMLSDLTLDLIFLNKSSLHHHPFVIGVLTLSKHIDWFPVRKFWRDLEENVDRRLRDRFLFEGKLEE